MMMASPELHEPQVGVGKLGSQENTITLEASHRISASISLHVFSLPPTSPFVTSIRPSQHITIQFPADLDPIYGSRSLSDDDRLMSFSLCDLRRDTCDSPLLIYILTRNGRVSGLLSLPRPQGQLTGEVVAASGGFPQSITDNVGNATCIAGGTGLATFLNMAASEGWRSMGWDKTANLICTLNGNDAPLIEYLLQCGILKLQGWRSVRFFITDGNEPGSAFGAAARESTKRLKDLRDEHKGHVFVTEGRMGKDAIDEARESGCDKVLFCGSKSLEWQVKMWLLNQLPVYITERV